MNLEMKGGEKDNSLAFDLSNQREYTRKRQCIHDGRGCDDTSNFDYAFEMPVDYPGGVWLKGERSMMETLAVLWPLVSGH